MGVSIVPAIYANSKQDVEQQLSQLTGFADTVQINVVDGKFAAPASWPYALNSHDLSHMVANKEMLPYWGRFRFEVDILADPEEVVGHWIAVGASRLTLHVGSTKNLEKVMRELEVHYGHDKDFASDLLSVGLSLGIDTDPKVIEHFIDRIDYVQFMGVARIGKHGEPFDKRVIERIKEFRKAHPLMPIQADSGVSRATAPALLQAGVSRLVVGSDLWRAENRAGRYQELKGLIEQYGIYE